MKNKTRTKPFKIIRCIFKPIRYVMTNFFPTSYVKFQYKFITSHELDLKNPIRYTEKLQYLRLFYYPTKQDVINGASKSLARNIVSDAGLENILIKSYGVFDAFEDIDFTILPNKFVIKATHMCAATIIVKDKNLANFNNIRKKCQKWLKTDYGKQTVEPHYSKIKPQLIIEELIGDNNDPLVEYKIHCFNGTPRYLYVVSNRGNDIRYNNYYIDFKPFDNAQFNGWKKTDEILKKPTNYDLLVKYAGILSKNYVFVRVDFFYYKDKIYFNELTFTPAKGTLIFDKDSADLEIGNWLNISKK